MSDKINSISLNNGRFDVPTAVAILKTKFDEYDKCDVQHPEIQKIWDSTKPITFKAIGKLDATRKKAAFSIFGINNLFKEVDPKLIDKQVITKTTQYIDPDGKLVTKDYKDTYELYLVAANKIGDFSDKYIVKCYCTSTNKPYLIWVTFKYSQPKDAIEAIANTIWTRVLPDAVEEIVRQGDCVLVKVKPEFVKTNTYLGAERSITKEEYITKLKHES